MMGRPFFFSLKEILLYLCFDYDSRLKKKRKISGVFVRHRLIIVSIATYMGNQKRYVYKDLPLNAVNPN
jgi:hypothetical protein